MQEADELEALSAMYTHLTGKRMTEKEVAEAKGILEAANGPNAILQYSEIT